MMTFSRTFWPSSDQFISKTEKNQRHKPFKNPLNKPFIFCHYITYIFHMGCWKIVSALKRVRQHCQYTAKTLYNIIIYNILYIYNMHVGKLTCYISVGKNYRLYKEKPYISVRRNYRLYKVSSQLLRYVHRIYIPYINVRNNLWLYIQFYSCCKKTSWKSEMHIRNNEIHVQSK